LDHVRLGREDDVPFHVKDRLKKLVFEVLLRLGGNPVYAVKSRLVSFKLHGELPPISQKFGIRLDTLQHQKDTGLDHPAYRFHRDADFFSYFVRNAERFRGSSWLDVGAGTGAMSVYLSEIFQSTDFELCDVQVPPHSNAPVKEIAGTHLDYENDSFDLVFFSYILHHAADNTIPLLRDAHRIARSYVAVTEDPKETAADCLWAYKHDDRGAFRGRKEWKELFSLTGFSVVYETPLDGDVHSREFFLLAPTKPGMKTSS
jgi:SAM-dependent methyltransferase